MANRLHEKEQFQHLLRVRRVVEAMEVEAVDRDTSDARRGVLGASVVLLWTAYQAPFRYRDWLPMDALASALPDNLLQARKAVRELGQRGVLEVRGTTKGPANTTFRLAHMPPYPIE